MVEDASATSSHVQSSGSSDGWVSTSELPVTVSTSWPRSTLKATTWVPQ